MAIMDLAAVVDRNLLSCFDPAGRRTPVSVDDETTGVFDCDDTVRAIKDRISASGRVLLMLVIPKCSPGRSWEISPEKGILKLA
jgi:hypothetical protein